MGIRAFAKKHFFTLALCSAAFAAAVPPAYSTVEQLSDKEEASHYGGGIWDTNDCIGGAIGPCPDELPIPNKPCAAAGICVGTVWCNGGLANKDYVCGPTYETNNPFNFLCVVDPAIDCPFAQRACNLDNMTCSTVWFGFNPICGTKTDCHN